MNAFKKLLCKLFGHQWCVGNTEWKHWNGFKDKTTRSRRRFVCNRCQEKSPWMKQKAANQFLVDEGQV